MDLTVDHVPFAYGDLEEITDEFERLGLSPEYGGVHDNGVTHMSILGFEDDSYLELIAERSTGEHDFWPAHIRADAGPAAWCIRVPDVAEECVRLVRAGQPVRGPLYGNREREDGTLVEWDRAEFGTPERRLLLPFAIEDRTPLSYRVTESPSVADAPLSGIGQVVLATQDPGATVSLFRRLYRFPEPVTGAVPGFGTVHSFPGQPVAVVGPETEWIADRLERFPEGPCACLFATEDVATARDAFPLREPREWPDGRMATFDSDHTGRRLGVLERE